MLCLLPLLHGCTYPERQNFDKAIISLEPRNFLEVNSAYDDFNSELWLARVGGYFNLVFSSNRISHGSQFDLVSYRCAFFVDLLDLYSDFRTYPDEYGVIFTYRDSLHNSRDFSLNEINTSFNEFGPYVVDVEREEYLEDQGGIYSILERHRRFFYASDSMGDLDIYCFSYHEYFQEDRIITGHRELGGINSPFNDAYPTLMRDSLQGETLFFTSDREGDFDLFSAVPLDPEPVDLATAFNIVKLQSLSSTADDKCPYLDGNLMVFTSNREGGYGGFDLYYSLFDGNSWSEPVNFGPWINTKYDEYRPVHLTMDEEEFFSDLLVFSSNRPGGKGGYDLYYAGMKK